MQETLDSEEHALTLEPFLVSLAPFLTSQFASIAQQTNVECDICTNSNWTLSENLQTMGMNVWDGKGEGIAMVFGRLEAKALRW